MPDRKSDESDPEKLRHLALSRWENEGGAGFQGPSGRGNFSDDSLDVPALTNAELVWLRIRVIALENLVIGLLSQASDQQLALAREMAAYICPRPGFTQHPLTIHAASQMVQLVERANCFRDGTPS
jgi:hypothetical protein